MSIQYVVGFFSPEVRTSLENVDRRPGGYRDL